MAGLVPFNRNKLSLSSIGFEDFYNVLDDFFSDRRSPRRSLAADTFKVDVKEHEKEYCIEAELPGVKKEEIHLELNEGRLTISVNRKEEVEENKNNYIHRERRLSSMQRAVHLADANDKGINAQLVDGVLSITIPKKEKHDNTIKIDIQ